MLQAQHACSNMGFRTRLLIVKLDTHGSMRGPVLNNIERCVRSWQTPPVLEGNRFGHQNLNRAVFQLQSIHVQYSFPSVSARLLPLILMAVQLMFLLLIVLTLQIQSWKCCALGEFLIKLWSMCITMHSVLVLLTTTWLETHQVHSTFRFEIARSTQPAVLDQLWQVEL